VAAGLENKTHLQHRLRTNSPRLPDSPVELR
jgi:hypothetical protein